MRTPSPSSTCENTAANRSLRAQGPQITVYSKVAQLSGSFSTLLVTLLVTMPAFLFLFFSLITFNYCYLSVQRESWGGGGVRTTGPPFLETFMFSVTAFTPVIFDIAREGGRGGGGTYLLRQSLSSTADMKQ